MANVIGSGIARTLVDRDGDPLDDGDGRLNINATLEAATVNIGDVDINSVPAPLSVTGAGGRSGVLRVTLATDDVAVGHLSEIEVSINEELVNGQHIGMAGNTGYTDGFHLHYEIYKDNNRTDPIKYIKLGETFK